MLWPGWPLLGHSDAHQRGVGGASQLTALGWLDANTVVEANAAGQFSLYEANGLTKIRDLGVAGIFEGLL
jgi:hypothetical protein